MRWIGVKRNYVHRLNVVFCHQIRWVDAVNKNATGILAAKFMSEKQESIRFTFATERAKDFFNNHNEIETIKEEFEIELKELEQYGDNLKMPMDEIYKNIGRITNRLNDLAKNHQTFYDIDNQARREINLAPNWKATEEGGELKSNLEYLNAKYQEINGNPQVKVDSFNSVKEYRNAIKGSYGAAKDCGLSLINEYQQQITKCYYDITEQLIRP